LRKTPRFVDTDICTACGDCTNVCPVTRPSEYDTQLVDRKAIYMPYAQAIPGAFAIEKLDTAPCRLACPAQINIQGYVQMVKEGKYKEAVEIIMQSVPFPGVLGRICTHRCEKSCRRLEVDEPVSIMELKRIAADHVDLSKIPLPEIRPRDEKMAIIGSGPAGLTAAYFLALDGYKVNVYEAMPETGGMLRYGIPEHRLPRSVLDAEIDNLKRYGIEIHTDTVIGRDLTIAQLLEHGAGAVFLSIGAWKGLKLRIPGEENTRGVADVISFLREVNLGNLKRLDGKMVVIGGGHSALDAAQTALRLGADEVHILYRRSRLEMLAEPEEVEDAEKEGVNIHFLTAPLSITSENEKVIGIECIRTRLTEADASGRRKPVPIEGSEFFIEADHIIPAIGQDPEFKDLSEIEGLKVSKWNLLEVNPETLQTNIPQIFAGGDVVTGPATVIEAVEAGQRAAKYMAKYLQGEGLPTEWQEEPPMGTQWTEVVKDEPIKERLKVPTLPMEKRLSGFEEVKLSADEQAAQKEAARCLNCGSCCECYQCVTACKANAVSLDTHAQQEETTSINVGAVILAPGFHPFDPTRFDNYQYANHANIVTSLEFERILSATGPFMGHLLRPSDKKAPKKVAWLQCVGSRDLNQCDSDYCSSVCCMYAVKEAVIAKEHAIDDLDCAIFYMDMRTPGKDFERYYNDAKGKHGIRFIRSRVHTIESVPGSDDLKMCYATEYGKLETEIFDMIVLSVGMETSTAMIDLADRLGINLTKANFCETSNLKPVATSREGIFVCGAFQGPKDIPESIMEASAAACSAGIGLASVRGSLVKEKEFPDERDVKDQEPRIGVFLCNCGINIGGIANIPAIAEFSKSLPNVAYVEDNLFTCSQDTQDKMVAVIKELNLNRVVVAACTPKTHEPLFQETIRNAGLNSHLFEMANIRNQCTWVHSENGGRVTEKCKVLVKMAVAKASLLEPIYNISAEVTPSALVIGGGIAGMTAALSLAKQDFPVTIVEKSSVLGGAARDVLTTWKGQNVPQYLSDLVNDVENHSDIDVLLNAELEDASGFVGNFETKVAFENTTKIVSHGVTIIATGGHASDTDEYLYGKHPNVTRWHELEQDSEKLKHAKSVVFIQCVGSRDENRPYCSRICCTVSVSQAISIKEQNPDTDVFILYREMRTFGEREMLYKKAREKGVIFIRYSLDNKPTVTESKDGLTVRVFDPILQRDLLIEADLINLATAIDSANNEKLASLYKLPLNEDNFFMEAHAKLRPVDFASDGLFLCGLAHAPKSIDESIAQAQAASARAMTVLALDRIDLPGITSYIRPELCSGCLGCINVCPFNAITFDHEKYIAEVNQVLCKGCGSCAASCASEALSLMGFNNTQLYAQIESALSA
jgi:heterodisulfide reductase subunit A2